MKSPGIATVLSFFLTGLGQLYNGQIVKGLFLMFTYAALWLFSGIPFVIGLMISPSAALKGAGTWCLVLFAFWVLGMVDARDTAERLNREQA